MQVEKKTYIMFLLTANSTASFIMLFVDKRYIRINTGQEAVFYFYFF